jgi:hypothetical protein
MGSEGKANEGRRRVRVGAGMHGRLEERAGGVGRSGETCEGLRK